MRRATSSRKATRENVRDLSPAYRELDDLIQTPEFLGLVSEMTGIPDLLYDPQYFGGGTHENLRWAGSRSARRLQLPPRHGLASPPEPDRLPESRVGGGAGAATSTSIPNAWDLDGDKVKTVLPLFNRCVIFETSERSWHGFSPVQLPEGQEKVSRKSFAIYLYTKERPPDETAAEHSTVYVPRAIPDDVRPGQVLTEDQYRKIKGHFIHHRGMLRMLYRREQRFNTEISALREHVAALQQALDDAGK